MTKRQMREFSQAREEIGQKRAAARAATTATHARDALLSQIRRTLDHPERASLRKAKDDRAYALRGFKKAMEYSQAWISDAVRRYVGTLSAEAAANRAEAREVRDLLAALMALYKREVGTRMDQDTSEVQA
jgi:Mg2+ and Co2+ transporter CorA